MKIDNINAQQGHWITYFAISDKKTIRCFASIVYINGGIYYLKKYDDFLDTVKIINDSFYDTWLNSLDNTEVYETFEDLKLAYPEEFI